MQSTYKSYKDKILKEIEKAPHDKILQLYKIIHLLTTELIPKTKKTGNRGSLKGIWKGSQIDESLYIKAKKSLFPYEHDGNSANPETGK